MTLSEILNRAEEGHTFRRRGWGNLKCVFVRRANNLVYLSTGKPISMEHGFFDIPDMLADDWYFVEKTSTFADGDKVLSGNSAYLCFGGKFFPYDPKNLSEPCAYKL